MTTFVRRIPDVFDEAYWHASAQYMERELGAVAAEEAQRHDNPSGFTDTAGQASGQRKDMSYCFAPYDGLRGLGMSDVCEFDALESAPVRRASYQPMGAFSDDVKAQMDRLKALSDQSGLTRALPYIAVGGAVLALVLSMRSK